MEVKSVTVRGASLLPTGGAAVMTMKLHFDFFDMCHHHDCVHVLLIWAALTRLSWQQTIKSAWTQIPTFYLSRPVHPRSTQIFTRQINLCYESCREITLSEFALDLPAYTFPHKDINISHRAFYL